MSFGKGSPSEPSEYQNPYCYVCAQYSHVVAASQSIITLASSSPDNQFPSENNCKYNLNFPQSMAEYVITSEV